MRPSGCFSLLAMLVIVCMCIGLFSVTHAARNGGFAAPPPNGFYQAPPNRPGGYYVAPFGGVVRNFFQGVRTVTGWAFGLIALVCIGLPAAFVILMLALFFFSHYQRERHHREMMDAQFARDRIIDYHTSQNPPPYQ